MEVVTQHLVQVTHSIVAYPTNCSDRHLATTQMHCLMQPCLHHLQHLTERIRDRRTKHKVQFTELKLRVARAVKS
jgi:hypothetical protein